MSSTLIMPDFTEIRAIKEKIEMLKELSIIPAGEKIQKITKRIYLDMTFDLFNKNITPSFLYQFFSDMEPVVNLLNMESTALICMKNYPFRTNLKHLLQKQKILDFYINILTEFFSANILYIPTIISRNSFQITNNPPIRIINALRLDNTEYIHIRKNSRFVIIYDRDLIDIFMRPAEEMKKNLILEGIEISLEDICNQTRDFTGDSPVSFDQTNFINYEYPETTTDSINMINYDFKNMIMDITSFLF